MAYKTVTDLSCDTTITIGGFNKKLKKDNPTQIKGYYLGSKKVVDNKKQSGFSYLYTFQTPKGNVGVWGRTDLDKKLARVAPGSHVIVTADGTLKVPTGEMYKYKVEYNESDTIEVSEESTGTPEPEYNDGGDDEAYVAQSAQDESEEDEDELQAAALALAAKKAKIEALLKGKKV